MGTSTAVRLATADDVEGMADALALAFEDDPVMQWLFGDEPPRPVKYLRPFFAHEGRRHLKHPHRVHGRRASRRGVLGPAGPLEDVVSSAWSRLAPTMIGGSVGDW